MWIIKPQWWLPAKSGRSANHTKDHRVRNSERTLRRKTKEREIKSGVLLYRTVCFKPYYAGSCKSIGGDNLKHHIKASFKASTSMGLYGTPLLLVNIVTFLWAELRWMQKDPPDHIFNARSHVLFDCFLTMTRKK